MLLRRYLVNTLCGQHNFTANLRQLQKLPHTKSHNAGTVGFHSTARRNVKQFIDTENQYAHDVLQQSLKPYQIFALDTDEPSHHYELPASVLQPTKTPATINADELYDDFKALMRYCVQTKAQLSDDRFQAYTKLYCSASHKLSDDQLIGSLRELVPLIPLVPSVKSNNFIDIWNALDAECCHRIDVWSTDQLLLVCDAWYALSLTRICEFVWEALRKLGRKVRKMRPEQLVQCMFYCNLMRRAVFDMFEFEVNLANCVDGMSLKELAVMSMGFFKTQTPIRNPVLLEHMYQRLMANVADVEDITLVSILKVLRYSSRLPQAELAMALLDALRGQIERLSLLSCLHVALLGSDLQCCHDEIVQLILERFERDLAQTRLKDLERICLVIGLYNFQSPSRIEDRLCAKILEVLQTRVDEIIKYPKCLPLCLHFLTLKGVYDTDMISSVLDPKFLRHAYNKSPLLGRELFHLDAFVKINLLGAGANYEGHQLTDKNRRTMGKIFPNYIPERNPKYKLNATDRILLEIKECTDAIFRRPVSFRHILPHYERADVVICYDRQQKKLVDIDEECPENYTGVILSRKELLGSREGTDVDTLAIVIAGWNNVIRDKNRHTGQFDMKLRQLQLLGHKPVVIYWHEWRELENQRDRQNFVKRRLSTVINL